MTRVFCILKSSAIDLVTCKIVHWTKHCITTIYVWDMCNITLQSFKSFQIHSFLSFYNPLMSFSKVEILLIHCKCPKKIKWPLKEPFIWINKRIIFIDQTLWFLRIKNRVSKFICANVSHLLFSMKLLFPTMSCSS